MKPLISIIGGRGKMGSLFAEAFRKENYTVLVSNGENNDNLNIAQQGDIVIVSVPITKTEEVVREIGPHVRKEALLTDFTSVKMKPVAAMLAYSQAQVIGGHPLFGPDKDLEDLWGQKMVLCPARGNARGKEYFLPYQTALESLGLRITSMSPEEHDRAMAAVQCLTYFSNMVFMHALNLMNGRPVQQDLAAPSYTSRLYAAARMLSQNHSLYTGILSENPFTEEAVCAYEKAMAEVSSLVKDNKTGELENLLGSLQEKYDAHCDYRALKRKMKKIVDE